MVVEGSPTTRHDRVQYGLVWPSKPGSEGNGAVGQRYILH